MAITDLRFTNSASSVRYCYIILFICVLFTNIFAGHGVIVYSRQNICKLQAGNMIDNFKIQ